MKRQTRPCQYGVFSVRCGAPSATCRERPSGGQMWDLCQRHADFLDRLRRNIGEHDELLSRLANG